MTAPERDPSALPRRPRRAWLWRLLGLALLCYAASYALLRATGALRPVSTLFWVDLSGPPGDDYDVEVRASDGSGRFALVMEPVFWPLREAEAAYWRTRPPLLPW